MNGQRKTPNMKFRCGPCTIPYWIADEILQDHLLTVGRWADEVRLVLLREAELAGRNLEVPEQPTFRVGSTVYSRDTPFNSMRIGTVDLVNASPE